MNPLRTCPMAGEVELEIPVQDTRSFRILVVEDDPEYQDWLKTTLEQACFTAACTNSVKKALRLLGGFTPDFILLDENLSDGSGMELCQEIRGDHRLAKIPIALLTGQRRVWSRDRWLRTGADACWAKPMSAVRLQSSIKALMRRREWDTKVIKPLIPGLVIDVRGRRLRYHDADSCKLSDRELTFVDCLCNAYPQTLSAKRIAAKLFDFQRVESMELALHKLVCKLKKKLPARLAESITAVYRRGYRLELAS